MHEEKETWGEWLSQMLMLCIDVLGAAIIVLVAVILAAVLSQVF